MSQPTFELGDLFGAALQDMTANRQEINALDGYNGNHGDNMVENLRLITESLQEKSSQTPAEALGYASKQLQSQGRGGTNQYYATGLSQAAQQFQGRSSLDGDDVMSLLQVLLGAIPSQGHQPQPQAGGSVLEQVLGIASGQPPQAMPQDSGLDLDDVLNTLLPAGLAFLQAKQSGADTASAATQALMSALMGGAGKSTPGRHAPRRCGGPDGTEYTPGASHPEIGLIPVGHSSYPVELPWLRNC